MRVYLIIALCLPYLRAQGVDFHTHYLQRAASHPVSSEFSLLLRLYQLQLTTTLAASYHHRYLLHSLLAVSPLALPPPVALPPPLSLPPDSWAAEQRLARARLLDAARETAAQLRQGSALTEFDARLPASMLRALLQRRVRYRGKLTSPAAAIDAWQRDSTLTNSTSTEPQALTHLLVRALLQALYADAQQLQWLAVLARRMPRAASFGEAEQRAAVAVLRELALSAPHDMELNNDEHAARQRLQRDLYRRRYLRQAALAGGSLVATLLLGKTWGWLRAVDLRALWSRRVLGMHLGYSVTTLAALYPAWKLGSATKRQLQAVIQTPPDLRGEGDYRIAYLVYISNPHNLQRQQEALQMLQRCLQRLQPLFAEEEIHVKVNPQRHRYRLDRRAARLMVAVPYTVSNDAHTALEAIVRHYYRQQLPPHILPGCQPRPRVF